MLPTRLIRPVICCKGLTIRRILPFNTIHTEHDTLSHSKSHERPEIPRRSNNKKKKIDQLQITKLQDLIETKKGHISISTFLRAYSKIGGNSYDIKHSFFNSISDTITLNNFITSAVHGFATKPPFKSILLIELENLLHKANYNTVHKLLIGLALRGFIPKERFPELKRAEEEQERIKEEKTQRSRRTTTNRIRRRELEAKLAGISAEQSSEQNKVQSLQDMIRNIESQNQEDKSRLSSLSKVPKETQDSAEQVTNSGLIDEDRINRLPSEDYFAIVSELAMRQKLWFFSAKFALNNHEPFQERPKAVNEIVDGLLYKNPTHEEFQINLIVKLVEKFKLTLNEYQARMLSEKIPRHANPVLTKKVSSTILLYSDRTTSVFLDNGYKAILKDFGANNAAGCAETWLWIKGFHQDLSYHDPRVLAVLLVIFTKNKKYRGIAKELVNEIPERMYSDPELIGPLLDLLSVMNRPDVANTICAQIKPPLSRPMLSTLLKLHVSFNDAEGTEKVLKQIYDMGSELSTSDYVIIVTQLLKKKQFSKALNVVKTIPLEFADMAYIAVINYIVDHSRKSKTPIEEINLTLIETLVRKVDELPEAKQRFWNRLGAVFFKHLAGTGEKEDLSIACQIYLNTYLDPEVRQYVRDKQAIRTKFDTTNLEATSNPFGVEKNRGRIILRCGDSARLTILKTLADGAVAAKDNTTLDFAIQNMLELGFSKAEIMLDLTKKYSRDNAAKGFNPRRVREDQFTPVARAQDIAKHDALNFITKRPLLKMESQLQRYKRRKSL